MVDEEQREVLKAICDPVLLANIILSDEAVYNKTKVGIQVDPRALSLYWMASLVFDQLVGFPVLFSGLHDILGGSFFDIFGPTIKKVQKSGFVSFGLEEQVPQANRSKLRKIIEFLNSAEESSRKVDSILQRQHSGLEPPYTELTYSQYANLPFVTSETRLTLQGVTSTPSANEAKRQFMVLKDVLTIELPEIRIKNLDDVLDVRQTYGAQEFRKVFRDFYRSVANQINDSTDFPAKEITNRWNRMKNESLDLLVAEFNNEISGWQTLKGSISY